MIVGVIVALPEETDTLIPGKIKKGTCISGEGAVFLLCSGSGAENARIASDLLVSYGVTGLISWGCAAALSKELKPGDLILPNVLVDANGRRDFDCLISNHWHQQVKESLSPDIDMYVGGLAESDRIVSTAKEKDRLYAETGAIALDMESIAIARIAKKNNLPFLAIRTVADPADMDLPMAINCSISNEGSVDLAKLLSFVIRHPSQLPSLVKLGCYFSSAKKTLKRVAKQMPDLASLSNGTLF